MKKTVFVIAVLILLGSAIASGQTFGFASVNGALYCDYLVITYDQDGIIAGYDNLSACGSSVNATISGFHATVPNDGPSAHGAGIVYGDSIYATLYGFMNAQWTLFSKLKCNKQNKFGQYTGAPGWEGVAAFSGFFSGVNAGPLSCSIPGKNGKAATRGSTVSHKN